MNLKRFLIFSICLLPVFSLSAQIADDPILTDSLSLLGTQFKTPMKAATPDASDGTYEQYVRLAWNGNSAIENQYFRLYRNTSEKTNGRVEVDLTKKKRISNNFAFDYDVRPGVLYYYWLEVENEIGEKSPFSDFDSGYIPESKPMATIIPYGPSEFLATGSASVLRWSPSAKANKYQVQIAIANNNTSWSAQGGFDRNTNILLDTVLTNPSFFWNGNNNAGNKFSWSVRAFNDNGETAYFSEVQEFNPNGNSETLRTPNAETITLSSAAKSIPRTDLLNSNIIVECNTRDASFLEGGQLLVYLSSDDELGIEDVLMKSYSLKNGNNEISFTEQFQKDIVIEGAYLLITVRSKQNILTKNVLVIELEK